MAYVYRGDKLYVPPPPPRPKPKPQPKPKPPPRQIAEAVPRKALKPCGTVAAGRRHYRNNEPICTPCREALRLEAIELRRSKGEGLMPLQPCGTEAAYARHLRKKETPCDPCRKAHAARRKLQEARYADASQVRRVRDLSIKNIQ